MATTNNEIIATYKMLNGITETIHTYSTWKKLGFVVRKGEKAKHRISVWKHYANTVTDKKTGEEKTRSGLFLKESCFFLESQVEPITAIV